MELPNNKILFLTQVLYVLLLPTQLSKLSVNLVLTGILCIISIFNTPQSVSPQLKNKEKEAGKELPGKAQTE